MGLRPAFDWPGTDGHEYNSGAFATITGHFDTQQLAAGRQVPFRLSTGDFAIAFDVFGSITVTERPGVNQFPGLKLGRVKTVPAANRMMLRTAALPGGKTRTAMGENGFTHFSLGPDGNVVLRVTEPRSNTGSVIDLGGRFDSSVTLVASANDTIHILGLTLEGEPVATTLSPEHPGGEGWVPLGGHCIGALTAAIRDEAVDVIAVDADGAVFHRHLPLQGRHGEWTPLGGRVVCPVAATTTPAGALAIFGLGPDGSVVHKRLDAERRRFPDGKEWEVVCAVGGRAVAERGGSRDQRVQRGRCPSRCAVVAQLSAARPGVAVDSRRGADPGLSGPASVADCVGTAHRPVAAALVNARFPPANWGPKALAAEHLSGRA